MSIFLKRKYKIIGSIRKKSSHKVMINFVIFLYILPEAFELVATKKKQLFKRSTGMEDCVER